MKPFSALTLALLALPLVAACTAQVTPSTSDDTSVMDDSISSSVASGPYLEDDETSSDADADAAVELNINASSSSQS